MSVSGTQACVCEAPTPPSDDYAQPSELLDAVLHSEAHTRLQHRKEAVKGDPFPYCSVFAPQGLLPIDTTPRQVFMEGDKVVSGMRAGLLQERQAAAAEAAMMEEAQLAALELKCMLLQYPLVTEKLQ